MSTRFDDPGSHSRALFERARRVIPGGTSKANFHVRPPDDRQSSQKGQGCGAKVSRQTVFQLVNGHSLSVQHL